MELAFYSNLNSIIDYLGTFAFAISGIRLASLKHFDLFGAYMIGLVTAIGGGTVRDLLLDVTPFWMLQPSYIVITGIALAASLAFKKTIRILGTTLFLFDAVGLGLFVVVGIEKSLAAGFPYWVSIIMGMITGTIGGVIRDVLVNEVPLLFRKDIYAIACIAGGIVYTVLAYARVDHNIVQLLAAATVISLRIVAIRYGLQMPVMSMEPKSKHQPGNKN